MPCILQIIIIIITFEDKPGTTAIKAYQDKQRNISG
jgi:hypothetical protein